MSLAAFIMIALSACSHATWNLLAKKSTMTFAFYTAICLTCTMIWLHTQFWTSVEVLALPWRFWLFTWLSVASDMTYLLGLIYAYRKMEISTAYPMMRALPLPLTALLTLLFGIGSKLSVYALTGMAIVFAGCLLIPLKQLSHFKLRNYLNSSMIFILVVACGTTGYTLCDKLAQGAMATAVTGLPKPMVALTYYSTRGICLASALLLVTFSVPVIRQDFLDFFRKRNYMPVLAGLFASMTYVLVLLAMNYVSNVSFVQVFRQIGLIFGVAGGVIFFKESLTLPKLLGMGLIFTGLVISVL
jgi:drug/metabolite transporter (DMT)-like permease